MKKNQVSSEKKKISEIFSKRKYKYQKILCCTYDNKKLLRTTQYKYFTLLTILHHYGHMNKTL